jgi:hypothetical protein
MYTCYGCSKQIKGKVTITSPPRLLVDLGIDFPKAFHPACYDKAEKQAAKELNREPVKAI